MKLTPGQFIKGVSGALVSFYAQLAELFRDVALGGWRRIEFWLLSSKKARYGLAITRIILGISGLGLLLSNFTTRLYSFGPGAAWNSGPAATQSELANFWLFRSFSEAATDSRAFTFLYLVLMLLAVLLILGWRSRLVLPLYFVMWVSFVESRAMLGDQGDNMYRITLFFLIFADSANRLSLDARSRDAAKAGNEGPWWRRLWSGEQIFDPQIGNLLHNLVLVILTVQVCLVYFIGGLYKASGESWAGGFAIYNPLMTDRFGPWPELSNLITLWAPFVALLTWGSVLLQLAFPFMLLTRPTRIVALFGILSFHLGIGLLLGLPWFSLTMIAIDAIFIRDRTWQFLGQRISTTFRESFDEAKNPAH